MFVTNTLYKLVCSVCRTTILFFCAVWIFVFSAFPVRWFPLFISPAGIFQNKSSVWFAVPEKMVGKHLVAVAVAAAAVTTATRAFQNSANTCGMLMVSCLFFLVVASSPALFLITPPTSDFCIVYTIKWNFSVLSKICAVNVYVGGKNATAPAATRATKPPTSHIVDSEQLPLLPSSAYLQFFDFCSILHKIYAHNIKPPQQQQQLPLTHSLFLCVTPYRWRCTRFKLLFSLV